MSMDGSKYPRGSEWRRWDLHIHSPLSGLNNQYPKKTDGTPDWDAFIAKIESLQGVSVIGVTDYFFIDGYKEVKEYKESGRLTNFDLILPNIELRLDTFVVNNRSRDINFHVIFSDELKVEDIEKEFIETLDVKVDGSVNGLTGVRQLNKRTIEEIGSKVKQNNAAYQNDSVESAAFKNITVSLDQVLELLRKELFKDKFLLVLAGHEWAHIDWNQAYLTKKNFLQTANILETGSQDTIKWALGRKDLPKDQFIKEFGALKACIFGSDAHCLDDVGCSADNKFCWIKADPTFEGLKQVVFEPEERVFIGDAKPKGKNDAKVIDRVEIKNSNKWFKEESVLLNENLIAIIGEKGAGKTALADFIALTGGDFDTSGNDSSSFIFKALKATKQIEDTIENCVITIHWKDGSSDSITINSGFSDYKNKRKVRYLSQDFIEKKCSPEQAEELQKEITDIVFQHIPIQDRLGQTTFGDLKNIKTKSVELKKSDCKVEMAGLNTEISNLEDEISSLAAKQEEKQKLTTEIEQLKEQKPKPSSEQEKAIEEKLSLLTKHKGELDEQIAGFKVQLSTLDIVKARVSSLSQSVEKSLTEIKADLESVGLVDLYSSFVFAIPKDFDANIESKKQETLGKIKKILGEVGQAVSDSDIPSLTESTLSTLSFMRINAFINFLESKSSMAEAQRRTLKSFEEKIEKNQKRIDELDKSIKDIEEVKKPLLPQKIEKRDKAYQQYFSLLQEEKKVLEEIYSPLKVKLSEEGVGGSNQLDFFARIELDVESFYRKGESIIDSRQRGRYCQNKERLLKDTKEIADKIELGENSDVHSLIMQMYRFFENNGGESLSIASQLVRGKKKLDFYNWIFDVSDFSVTYSIKYQGTNIELLSPGKKGIVLLLMYLSLDTESGIPLIIDQPEENLDNKSVYNYLIDYFKLAKKRRQILVITHNPNLVLNTDSEQIIVANFEAVPSTYEARITYVSGAIENSYINDALQIPLLRQGIREHGADILEGGKEAFIKRKEKYAY